jgi:hypothetical protein
LCSHEFEKTEALPACFFAIIRPRIAYAYLIPIEIPSLLYLENLMGVTENYLKLAALLASVSLPQKYF